MVESVAWPKQATGRDVIAPAGLSPQSGFAERKMIRAYIRHLPPQSQSRLIWMYRQSPRTTVPRLRTIYSVPDHSGPATRFSRMGTIHHSAIRRDFASLTVSLEKKLPDCLRPRSEPGGLSKTPKDSRNILNVMPCIKPSSEPSRVGLPAPRSYSPTVEVADAVGIVGTEAGS